MASIYLNTNAPFDQLTETNMLYCKPSPTPISQVEQPSLGDGAPFEQPKFFSSVNGGIAIYLVLSWLHISFTVNKLSWFMHNPTQNNWKVCKRLLRYLKGTMRQGILFKQ